MPQRDRRVRAILAVSATVTCALAVAFATTSGPTPAGEAFAPVAATAPAPPPPDTVDETAPAPDDTASQMQAALVTAEDDRILAIVSDPPPGGATTRPYEVATPNAPATMVLPARERPYDLAALERLGAVRATAPGTWTFDRSVLVGNGATLRIEQPGGTLRLPGVTSIVAFKGTLELVGAPGAPLTVTSWDGATRSADRDPADGRAYLRSSGGRMDLRDVRATDLGFWSGRTGGIAWTGSAGEPGAGSAIGVTAERNQYGLFASRVLDLRISGGAARDNAVDGVLVHRESAGVTVEGIAVIGNARHGVAISPGTERITVSGITAERNADTGVRIDGTAIAVAASAGGASTRPGAGFTVEGSTVTGNGRVGVLADTAAGLVVRDNTVVGSPAGLVVRGATVDPAVLANRVEAAEFAVAVRDGVVGAELTDNTVGPALIAVQVTDSAARLRANTVTGASRYGVSLVGAVSGSEVDGNTLSGLGLAALDTNRVAVGAVVIIGVNDDDDWTVDRDNFAYWRDYVADHPLLWLWLLLLLLPLVRWWSHRRARATPPAHPYAHVPPGPSTAAPPAPGRPALTPADRLALARASTQAAEQRPRPVPGGDARIEVPSGDGVESTVALPVTRVTVVSGSGAAR